MFVSSLPQRLQHFKPNSNDHFDIYGNLILFNLQLEHTTPTESRIHVHLQCSNGTYKQPILA
ncbi:hypothetical protein J3R82DRAFT_2045 [Butyriboletus roseoflavus]|nr:hypothetical protein J3R82DRAFT_2045 [Butyriboletus roseoflavus]